MTTVKRVSSQSAATGALPAKRKVEKYRYISRIVLLQRSCGLLMGCDDCRAVDVHLRSPKI
jgi:hypothetical protein